MQRRWGEKGERVRGEPLFVQEFLASRQNYSLVLSTAVGFGAKGVEAVTNATSL